MNIRHQSSALPFTITASLNFGSSLSSLNQIGHFLPHQPLGRAHINCFANARNGNLIVEDRELKFANNGHHIKLGYIYNSLIEPIASRWKLSVGRKIQLQAEGTLTVLEQDGQVVKYAYDTNDDSYHATQYVTGCPRIQYNTSEKQYTYYHPATRVTEIFNSHGDLIKQIDSAGNVTTYEYTNDQQISAVVAPQNVRYEIDRTTNIVQLFLNNAGIRTLLHIYNFDNDRNLRKSIAIDEYEQNGYQTTYDYNTESQKLSRIEQDDSSLLRFDYYNDQGKDEKKLKSIQVGADKNSLNTFSYTDNACTFETATGGKSLFYFDEQGKINEFSQASGYNDDDKEIDAKKYKYNAAGQIEAITYPDNSVEKFEYDAHYGLLQKHIERHGAMTKYIYTHQESGQPVLSEKRDYASENDENPPQQVFNFLYDTFKQNYLVKRYEISSLGRVKEYTTDDKTGLIASEREYTSDFYNGPMPVTIESLEAWKQTLDLSKTTLTTYTYDEQGRVARTMSYAALDQKGQGKGLSVDHQFKYDEYGQLTYESLNAGTVDETISEYKHTPFGELRKETNLSRDKSEQTTLYIHRNNLIFTLHPNLTMDSETYNTQGLTVTKSTALKDNNAQLKYEYQRGLNGEIYAVKLPGQESYYSLYDRQGRLGFEVTPNGSVTEYEYNKNLRYRIKTQYANQIDTAALINKDPSNQPSYSRLQELLEGKINPDNRKQYEFYNLQDKIKYEIDAENCITEYIYLPTGQLQHKITYENALTQEELNNLLSGKELNRTLNRKTLNENNDRIWSYFYDQDGLKMAEQDPAGYVGQFIKDASGRVKEKINFAKPNLTFTNDFSNFTLTIEDPENAKNYYFYNALSQCVQEIDAEGYITTKDYYPNGKIKTATRCENKVASEWYTDTSKEASIISSNNDKVTRYFYDKLDRLTHETDSHGAITTYTYDAMNRPIATDQIDAKDTQNIAGDYCRGNEKRYDDCGRLIAEINPVVAQKIKAIDQDQTLSEDEKKAAKEKAWETMSTRYEYLEFLKIKVKDPLNNTTLYYYDQDHKLVLTINPAGAVTENTYNAFGEVMTTQAYETPIDGETLQTLSGGWIDEKLRNLVDNLKTNPKNIKTAFKRDKRGKITQKIDPKNHIYEYEYTSFGERKNKKIYENEQNPALNTIQYEYDQRGLLITTLQQSNKNEIIKCTNVRDNLYGHPTTTTDENGYKTVTTYDRLGRLKTCTQEISKDNSLVTNTCQYDAFDRLKETTDASNRTTSYSYKDKKRQIEITHPDKSVDTLTQNRFGETTQHQQADKIQTFSHTPLGLVDSQCDASLRKATTQYDILGRIEEKISLAQIKTKYTYDGIYLKEEIVDPEKLKLITQYEVNAFGQHQKVTDARKIVTTYDYDKNNNIEKTVLDPNGLNLQSEATYNVYGSKTSIAKSDGTPKNQYNETYRCDAFNRKTATIVDPSGLSITDKKIYDNKSQIITTTNQCGFKTRVFYDGLGRKRFTITPAKKGEVSCLIGFDYSATGALIGERIYANHLASSEINEHTSLDTLLTHPISTKDNVTLTIHDAMDRPRFIIKLLYDVKNARYLGYLSEKRYDDKRRLSLKIDYNSILPSDDHKALTLAQLEEFASKQSATPNNHQISRTIYNKLDQPILEINPAGAITETFYNTAGLKKMQRVRAAKFEDKSSLLSSSDQDLQANISAIPIDDERDQLSFTLYDSVGRITYQVNQEGAVTLQDYDENNNVIQSVKFADKIKISSNYDEVVNQATAKEIDAKNDLITVKKYDANNRLQRIETNDGCIEAFEYDEFNNKTKYTDKNQQVFIYQYDKANRNTQKISPTIRLTTVNKDASGALTYDTKDQSVVKKIDYDQAGNMQAITEGEGLDEKRVFETEFDALNRPIANFVTDALVDIADETVPANFNNFPHKKIKTSSNQYFDIQGLKIAEKDANDQWSFTVYDSLSRPIYFVAKDGRVLRYTYNALNQIEELLQYATPIKIDPPAFIDQSAPLAMIEGQLETNKEDRITKFAYDNGGNVESTQKGEIFYYSNGTYGLANPQTDRQYNLQGKCISEKQRVSPDVWSEKRTWYDRLGNKIAEVDANLFLTTYRYNAFGKLEGKIEYANALSAFPDFTATSADLTAAVKVNNEKDRCYEYRYDLSGNCIAEIRKNVPVEKLLIDGKGIASLVSNRQDLVKQYLYDNMNRITTIIYENSSREYQFRNARGDIIGEKKISRTRTDEKDQEELMTPLMTYGVNAFGQPTRITRHKKSSTADDQFNEGKVQQDADDQTDLFLFDKRGMLTIKQNAENQLTGYTYTSEKKLAREFYLTNTWKQLDNKTYKSETHLDENRYKYNQNNSISEQAIVRDNKVEQKTIFQRNAFGEVTNEGEDGNTWPLYRKMNGNGKCWLSNENNGVTAITLHDLMGRETLQMKSPEKDLSTTNDDQLSQLLSNDDSTLERTVKKVDLIGHILEVKEAFWQPSDPLPTRSLRYDRWGNIVHEEDSFGHATDREFNDANNETAMQQPETNVVGKDGITKRERSVIRNGYNEHGIHLGTTNAEGNTEGYVVDEAGQVCKHILGDGTTVLYIADIFGRVEKMINPAGKISLYYYNHSNHLTDFIYPSGRKQHYEHDRFNNRTLMVAVDASATYRFNYDARRNLTERFEPLGYKTEMAYDRNHQLINEILPNSGVKSWKRDYFGLIETQTKLSGEIYIYDYDKKRQLKHEYSTQGLHGNSVRFWIPNATINNNIIAADYQYNILTAPKHDIRYEYKFGLKFSTYDAILDRKIQFTHDSNGICKDQIITDNSGKIIKHLNAEIDELHREIKSTDIMLTGTNGYSTFTMERGFDGNNSVRFRTMNLQPDSPFLDRPATPMRKNEWFLYDDAERITISKGVLSSKIIHITKGQGCEMSYKFGLRSMEHVITDDNQDITTTILHDKEGRRETSLSSNKMTTIYDYRVANITSCYENKDYLNGTRFSSQVKVTWNDNFFETRNEYFETDMNTPKTRTAIFPFEKLNLPHEINSVAEVTDDYIIDYIGLDNYFPSYAHGYRNNSAFAAGAMLYTNDIINSKMNTADERPNVNYNVSAIWPVFFDTLPDRRIMSKHRVHFWGGDSGRVYDGQYFFHSINDGIIGLFTENLPSFKSMSYAPIQQNLTTFTAPIMARETVRIAPTPKSSYNNLYFSDYPLNPQSMVPRVYVVSAGDTFSSIAKETYGEEDAAEKIAENNGWLTNQRLSPGLVLFLPTYTPVKNKVSSSQPYNEFISIISGNIAPYFPPIMQQLSQPAYKRKKHHHWWETFLKIIIVGIALLAVPMLSAAIINGAGILLGIPTLTAATANSLIAGAASGVAAGIMDASAQGFAIGLGVQNSFSWSEVLETSIAYGAMSGPATDFAKASIGSPEMFVAALKVGAAAVGAQLASMAAGLTSKFDVSAVAMQFVSALAGAEINQAIGKYGSMNRLAFQAENTMATTLMNSALGSVVYHTPLNLEDIAANALGSMVVQTTGDLAESQSKAKRFTPQEKADFAYTEEVTHTVLPPATLNVSGEPQFNASNIAQADLPSTRLDLSTQAIGREQARYNSTVGFFHRSPPAVSAKLSTPTASEALQLAAASMGDTGQRIPSSSFDLMLQFTASQMRGTSMGVLAKAVLSYRQDIQDELSLPNTSVFEVGMKELGKTTGAMLFLPETLPLEAASATVSRVGFFSESVEVAPQIIEKGGETIKALTSPREFLLSKVENPKLKSMVKYLYREGAEVGNGGTADVLRHELSTGDLYSKSGHVQKAIEARISLKRLIDSGNLNHQDYGIATSLRQELHEALAEQEWDKIYTNRQAMRN